VEFTEKLMDKLKGPSLDNVSTLSQKLFSLEGHAPESILTSQDLSHLTESRDLLQKVCHFLDYISVTQATYLASVCKFSYLTQRVFLYLIY
jgi:hypothetical protein